MLRYPKTVSPLRLVPITLATAACLVAGAVAAQCCSVPVFRYALDHWNADPFRLEVSPSDFRSDALANTLRNLGENSPFNLEAERSNDPASPSRLFAPARGASRGAPSSSNHPLWEGSLTPETFRALTESPARREIAKLIVEGHSMVWVLVETGQPSVDEPARELLQGRLRFLEKVSDLPPLDPSDPSNKLGPGPTLAIKLGSVRVSRNDQTEQPLIKMLAGPQGLDPLPADKPFAAVVFGRGRVLGVWSDPDESTIEDASRFLMGACSCQVKNGNPGWDLLTATAWDQALRNAEQQRLAQATTSNASGGAPPTANSSPVASQPETVVFESSPAATPSSPSTQSQSPLHSSRLQSSVALLIAALALVLSVLARKRSRP
jgi:hypothetical protein